MTQEQFETIWHELNKANAEVVIAKNNSSDEEQIYRLLTALESVQIAEKTLLESLADI